MVSPVGGFMKRSRSARIAADLSASVHHQLNMYVLAASAAGVGMLALAQPAEAKIVYTPAHVILHSNSVFNLDLNHDGPQPTRRRDDGSEASVRPSRSPEAGDVHPVFAECQRR